MKKTCFVISFLVLLTGCFPEKKQDISVSKPSQCFEIMPAKDDLRPLMFNKCTGESWLLVYTILERKENGGIKYYTYAWHPLTRNTEEPIMFPSF